MRSSPCRWFPAQFWYSWESSGLPALILVHRADFEPGAPPYWIFMVLIAASGLIGVSMHLVQRLSRSQDRQPAAGEVSNVAST
jgi:hypothetical protein